MFRLHRAGVDDFVDVRQVTIGKGRRDMYEGFELWHLTGHKQELLGGRDVKLHGVSAGGEAEGSTVRQLETPPCWNFTYSNNGQDHPIFVAAPQDQEERRGSWLHSCVMPGPCSMAMVHSAT